MCVNGVRLFGGDVRMVVVKSVPKNGGFCFSLDDYNRASHTARV